MKILSALFLIFFYSCAVSQPIGDTDTKNKKARESFQQAYEELNVGEPEKALELVNKALEKDPAYIDAYFLKADILRALRRYDESQQAYDKILSLRKDLTQAYLYMGEMQMAAERYPEALKSLEAFLSSGRIEDYEKEKVNRLLPNARFAVEAIKKPVPFVYRNMGTKINTLASEYLPGLTADEQTFIFTRKEGQLPQEDFYISKWNGTDWSQAVNIGPPVNTPGNEGCVSISTDGQFIFFAACAREDGAGSCDLYFSKLNGSTWNKPKKYRPI